MSGGFGELSRSHAASLVEEAHMLTRSLKQWQRPRSREVRLKPYTLGSGDMIWGVQLDFSIEEWVPWVQGSLLQDTISKPRSGKGKFSFRVSVLLCVSASAAKLVMLHDKL